MAGDYLKVKAYIQEYGYEFVVAAIERAVDLKNAREMAKDQMKAPTVSRRNGEARILMMANERGVKIGNG